VNRRDAVVPVLAVAAALLGAPVAVVYALAATGVATSAAALVRALGPTAEPLAPVSAARPTPQPPRRLVEARRLVAARGGSAGGVHFWLRPLLQDVAAERLRRRGLDVEEATVPEPLWELVRPDRPPPPDRNAAAPDLDALEHLVDQAASL
jgi:hypothetical protein